MGILLENRNLHALIVPYGYVKEIFPLAHYKHEWSG